MGFNRIILVIAAVCLMFAGMNSAFSQSAASPQDQVVVGPEQTQAPAAEETQWVWGEIVSVDAAKNQLNIKYLDYENDTEKEIAITADAKTVFENVGSLAELKPKDTVSVDYVVTSDGLNVAKNITIEKPEEGEVSQQKEMPAPAATAVSPATSEQSQQQGAEAASAQPEAVQPEQPKSAEQQQ